MYTSTEYYPLYKNILIASLNEPYIEVTPIKVPYIILYFWYHISLK